MRAEMTTLTRYHSESAHSRPGLGPGFGKQSATGDHMSDESKPSVMDEQSSSDLARSIYADFTIWEDRKKKPKWHPVKKMRYVFFRMIDGITIRDALREIKWQASEFWHLVDLERNAPFRLEYKQARMLQGRSFADSVMEIAEGRDTITKRSLTKTRKLITKALARASKQKSPLAAKAIIERLLNDLNENDAKIIARNKVQIDAAKWLAKSANPNEFNEKTSLALNGGLIGEGGTEEERPIRIQFIGPDGSVVELT